MLRGRVIKRTIFLFAIIAIPEMALAVALPTAPLDRIPNEVGEGSVNPYLNFSQNEYIDLSSGLVTLNPKGLKMQLGSLSMNISPSYHPNRGRFGTGELNFSAFHALAYPSVDKAVYTLGMRGFADSECPPMDPYTEINTEEGEKELPCEFRYFPMGDLGYFSVNRFAQISRAAFKVNDKKWLFGVNGIVGALGAEIELGDQGNSATVYMLIRSDGVPIFLSTAEKEEGFRKRYKLLGDHRFSAGRFVVEDPDGVRYTFTPHRGFRSTENYRSEPWASRIETRMCYRILGLFGDCSPHLNFPGWRAQPFFLSKIEDPQGNEIRITSWMSAEGRVSRITTGKAIIDFIEGSGQVIVISRAVDGFSERRWVYTLNGDGNVTSISDPDGNVTTYSYPDGNLHETIMAGQLFGSLSPDAIVKITNPLGGITQFDSYYGSALRGTVVTERSSQVTQKTVFLAPLTTTVYEYGGGTTFYDFVMNENVRLLREKRATVGGELIQETYEWKDNEGSDDEGHIIYGASRVTSGMDGQSFITENTYDTDGRLVESRRSSSANEPPESVRYTYFCDDVPPDKRIVSHQVKSLKFSKDRLLEEGRTVRDDIELTIKPFFPLRCETETIYRKFEGVDIDIGLSDIYLALLFGGKAITDAVTNDVMDYIESEVETPLIHEYVVNKIKEVVGILSQDTLLRASGQPMTIDVFVERYNQLVREYIDIFNNESPDKQRRRCTYYGQMAPPESSEEAGFAKVDCWATVINDINEIDRFPELQFAMNALSGMIRDSINGVVANLTVLTSDPAYQVPYDDIYALAHDTLGSLFALSPVKPDMPFAIGQITMKVNGGAEVPLRRYFYEMSAGDFTGLGDIVKGGPLVLEIDEKGMHTTYLYHFCDLEQGLATIARVFGSTVNPVCRSLDDWRRKQVNKQILTAKIVGRTPAGLRSWYTGFTDLMERLRGLPLDAKVAEVVKYYATPGNQLVAEVYGHDLEHDNPSFRTDSNMDGQGYQFSNANDLRKITFLNQSHIEIRPVYSPGSSNVTQITHDITRNQTLSRTQRIDGFGRVTSTVAPGGAVTRFNWGPNKKVERQTNPDGTVTRYGYDELDRLVYVEYPGGQEVAVSYGRETKSVLGGKTIVANTGQYWFESIPLMKTYRDFENRIVEIKLAGGEEGNLLYRYQYDTLGNLIRTEGPDGRGNKYLLDAFSRIETIAYPDGAKLIASGYNNFNRPGRLEFVNPDYENIPVDISYDSMGRVTGVNYPNASDDNNLSFTYDQSTLRSGGALPFPSLGNNRLTSITDGNGSAEFSYTAGGASLAVNRHIKSILPGHMGNPEDDGAMRLFVEDGFSNPKSTLYTGKFNTFVANYETDNSGRLSRVYQGISILPGGVDVASFGYDAGGRVVAINFANGVSETFTYRLDGRIESLHLQKGGKDLASERYTYDYRGNKASVRYLDGSSVEYHYTDSGQIKFAGYYAPHGIMSYFSQEYEYDADGNRGTYRDGKDIENGIGVRTVTYTYNANRLDSYTTGRTKVAYKYDRWGNVLQELETYDSTPVLTKDFQYDMKGNLTSVRITNGKSGETSQVNYKYDYKGRREIKDVVGGEKTFYFYDKGLGLFSEWKESNGTVGVHFDHVYAGGMPIATSADRTPIFIHSDETGTPRWITDMRGRIIEANRFDPYGNISMHVGSSFASRRYQGAVFDEETGLYYLNGRYYDPRIGRFISTTRSSGNYTFAASNPLSDVSVIRAMNEPVPQKTEFIGVTGGDRFLEDVASSAKEGTDDFGGAGFICVEADVSGSVTFLTVFDTDLATNIKGCIDSTTPFSDVPEALGGQMMGEAESELKQQAINGIIKDISLKVGIIGGSLLIASSAFLGPAALVVGGAMVIGGAIFYAFTGNWTAFKAFFGFVDYEYMNHPPEDFKETAMLSNGTNRFLDDPGKFLAFKGLANLGHDSLSVLNGLAEFGVIPVYDDPLMKVEPFGLRANIMGPIVPYRFNGQFNGGSLMGRVF